MTLRVLRRIDHAFYRMSLICDLSDIFQEYLLTILLISTDVNFNPLVQVLYVMFLYCINNIFLYSILYSSEWNHSVKYTLKDLEIIQLFEIVFIRNLYILSHSLFVHVFISMGIHEYLHYNWNKIQYYFIYLLLLLLPILDDHEDAVNNSMLAFVWT